MVELVRSGRNPEELSREFEPTAQAIRNWVAQADRDEGRRADGLTTAERQELGRLRRENRQLRIERDLVKSRGLVRSGDRIDPVEGFEFVKRNQADYPVATLCRILGISTSGYYAWLNRPPSAWAQSDARLSKRIRALHQRSRASYGVPRILEDLQEEGERVNHKRVARLMRSAGLVGISRRKGFKTTVRDRDARPAPDRVQRCFTAERPDRLWVADITYVPTLAGFLFLAVVMDVFSRRIVGWAMATHLRTELILNVLNMAIYQRRPQGCRSIIPTRARSTHPLLLERAARRLAYDPPWVRSATVSITPCAKASSPRSNASCWTAAASRPRPRRRWPFRFHRRLVQPTSSALVHRLLVTR